MEQASLPAWERDIVDQAITEAEARLADEKHRARRRAVQLAREQAYHRLAVEIARPGAAKVHPDQLALWPSDPTLFDNAS